MFKPIRKRDILLQIPIAIVAIVIALLLIRNSMRHRAEMKHFVLNEFAGTLVSYRDGGRGTLSILVATPPGMVNYDLMGFKQYMDRIQVGDSLYKKERSDVIKVYRKNTQGEYIFHTDMPPIGEY